jgi:Reeler domain
MMIRLGLCAFLVSSAIWANPGGAPAGAAGVPGEGSCGDCHGTGLNTGTGRLTVSLVDASTWTPGQQVRLRVTLADPTARRWGFQITARGASNPNTTAGVFALADATVSRRVTGFGGAEYITHTSTGTRPGTADSSSWEVLWTPPADASFGAVSFYAAGNAANNNGQSDAADKIYTTSLNVSPAGDTPATSYALSQLAFGGGWYTAVYLYNSNAAAATATLNYFGTDGQPLNITNVGTSSTVNLGAKATGFVEAADLGPLTQGWIELKLPDGVTGYGVFRQTVAGRPQEAVVPLANTVSTTGTFIFDETNYVTAAAYTNVGSGNASVTVTARDAAGAAIGTSTFSMATKARSAVVLNSLAGLEAMRGKRGTVEFSSSAPITLLGLRFNGEAFTSIPAVQK